MTNEQKELLKQLLSSSIVECREELRQCEIMDTYHGTMSNSARVKNKIQLIEETFKEIDTL